VTHQQAIESDAVAPEMTSPSPEVRDSTANLRAGIAATPTAGLVDLYEELADRRWPDLDSLLAYRTLIERCLREDPEGLMSSFEESSGERRARELVQVWLEIDADGLVSRVLADDAPATQLLRREPSEIRAKQKNKTSAMNERRSKRPDQAIAPMPEPPLSCDANRVV
jgi:hypothetical protein